MAPQSFRLPPRPNLAHLKRQAKQLLRDHKAGRPEVCDTFRRIRRFDGHADAEILAQPLPLHDAQYALALAYGCESWATLRARVESARGRERKSSAGPISGGALWDEIDAVNEAYFWNRPPTAASRKASAAYIAGYQGGPGAYAGMFRPDRKSAEKGLRLFTGERVPAGGGACHILGEEACRALRLLGVNTPGVRKAMARAEMQMLAGLGDHFGRPTAESVTGTKLLAGMFCCMKCSSALWRHLLARGQSQHAEFLTLGVKALKSHRDGEAGWRGWPFAYTLSALVEYDMEEARRELQYASPACEEELKRKFVKTNVYSQRRREVMQRALGAC